LCTFRYLPRLRAGISCTKVAGEQSALAEGVAVTGGDVSQRPGQHDRINR
jgi:hypothetical protein